MSTDPFDDEDRPKVLGEMIAEAFGQAFTARTGEPKRLTVAEMAAGQAARFDPPTEARVPEAANHRVGTRRDQEIGELKARLDRVENELYLSRQVAKMAANGARSLRLLASKLHGDVRTLSTNLDERLRTLESGLSGTRDAGK